MGRCGDFGNLSEVPGHWKILAGAFNSDAMYGGIVGVLIQGSSVCVLNEAGIGSASIAHSAAKTDEPVSEGIVAFSALH